jgi:hypothetical protein
LGGHFAKAVGGARDQNFGHGQSYEMTGKIKGSGRAWNGGLLALNLYKA